MGPESQAAVRQAGAKGLVVNASTESRSAAAALVRKGLQAVCVVPPDMPAMFRQEGGRTVQCISCSVSLQLRGLPTQNALRFPEWRDHLCLGVIHGPRLADVCQGARRRGEVQGDW